MLNFLKTLKAVKKIYAAVLFSKNKYIVFDHALGGGANVYSQKLIKNIFDLNKNSCVIYITIHFWTQRFVVTIFHKKNGIPQKTSFPSLFGLKIIIKLPFVSRIYINNLVSYTDTLKLVSFFIKSKQILEKTIFLLHDYYCICPKFMLFSPQNRFCNIPRSSKICQKCLSLSYKDNPLLAILNIDDILLWRKTWSLFLENVRTLETFSQTSAKLLLKAYPSLRTRKIIIKPHIVDYITEQKSQYSNKKKYRLAVLGQMTQTHKGTTMLNKIANELSRQSQFEKLVIIGEATELLINHDQVIVLGKYRQSKINELIQLCNVDAIFIPSLWPETYSYTTEEAIKTGLPVIVFSLGAQAERTHSYSRGLVLSTKNPKNILKEIYQHLNKLKK